MLDAAAPAASAPLFTPPEGRPSIPGGAEIETPVAEEMVTGLFVPFAAMLTGLLWPVVVWLMPALSP